MTSRRTRSLDQSKADPRVSETPEMNAKFQACGEGALSDPASVCILLAMSWVTIMQDTIDETGCSILPGELRRGDAR